MLKKYLSEVQEGLTPDTWWPHTHFGSNKEASIELKEIFGGKQLFDAPKPKKLLTTLVKLGNDSCGIVLDFFAGAATTAHAVMQLNAEDGGNRKFIIVQLPEPCDEKSEAFKAGYKTIAEISKERIRRAGKKILEGECHQNWSKDIGFRVLKLDSSNMAEVYYTPDAIDQGQLNIFTDNIKPDRTPEDLLFQVLLDWGVDLSLPIRKETIQGKAVFFVDENALVACFDTGVNEELVKELAGFKPLRVVFRDNGFVSDAVKINVEQIFKQMSPGTEVKAI
jgi:adenine-specific DNA-methyltransferase